MIWNWWINELELMGWKSVVFTSLTWASAACNLCFGTEQSGRWILNCVWPGNFKRPGASKVICWNRKTLGATCQGLNYEVALNKWYFSCDLGRAGKCEQQTSESHYLQQKKSLASPMVSSSQNVHLEWQRSHSKTQWLKFGANTID